LDTNKAYNVLVNRIDPRASFTRESIDIEIVGLKHNGNYYEGGPDTSYYDNIEIISNNYLWRNALRNDDPGQMELTIQKSKQVDVYVRNLVTTNSATFKVTVIEGELPEEEINSIKIFIIFLSIFGGFCLCIYCHWFITCLHKRYSNRHNANE